MKLLTLDGKPIFNAKRALKVTVSKKNCDSADRKEPGNCAMAKACRQELHVLEARVHLGRVYVRTAQKPDRWTRYQTTAALRTEIIAFDKGGSFAPGEYTLAALPPKAAARYGKQQGSKQPGRKKNKDSGKRRKTPHVVTNVRGGPAI